MLEIRSAQRISKVPQREVELLTKRGRPRNNAARERVVASAARLFTERGYLTTTIGEIAADAGVSIPTIYAAYGSKVGVLSTALDATLAGDFEPVPLAERDWFLALADQPTAADAWRAALTELHLATARVAPVYKVALAAEADPDVGGLMKTARSQQAEFSRLLGEQILARPGAEGVDRTRFADVVYAVERVETYLLFVEQCGWSIEQWRDWVSEVVMRELNPR